LGTVPNFIEYRTYPTVVIKLWISCNLFQ